MKRTAAFFLVGCLLMLPLEGRASDGYHALISCGEGFLAAGSKGRLDWISTQCVVTKSLQVATTSLNALLLSPQTIVVAGDSGTLLLVSDTNSFHKVPVESDASIFCLVSFNNHILAGSEQGLLLVGKENGSFQHLSLALEGNIVSLSANETDCFGVTDQGEILHSTDGLKWNILDFNTYYKGYYKPCRFTSVLANAHQIAIAGKNDDGTPALFLSNEGTIWAERTLNYSDEQHAYRVLEDVPVSMAYDAVEDQLLLVCNKGKVLVVPACSHCNRLITVSTEPLQAFAQNESKWLAVGFSFHALPTGWK